ncbi:hypothetical protein HY968_02290 [Candidatus Kaiserbacteria bacterium]|nr:hypothetical protein [Candidatus Kaiserbacteria bacterium]
MQKIGTLFAGFALVFPVAVSALVVQNYGDTNTGGQVSSGQVTVTGNSDADAEIHTMLDGDSGKIEIRAASDGVVHSATIITKPPIQAPTVLPLDAAQGTQASTTIDVQAASTTAHVNFFISLWVRLRSFFSFF